MLFHLVTTCFLFISSILFSMEENFFLINGITEEVLIEKGPYINKRISPCSTFKMTLSLMGYDAGFLQDEINPSWDFQEGYDDFLPAWKSPQNPQSWMKYSCVWYTKLLALQLGLEKVQGYVSSFGYGNQDISEGLAKPAWINSSLTISPKEQVHFIQKILLEKLPVSPKATQMTKILLFKENLPGGWQLFGKTGWSGCDITKDGKTLEHGWFVGWVEKDHSFFPFAYLIRAQKIHLDQRIPRVKEFLLEAGLL